MWGFLVFTKSSQNEPGYSWIPASLSSHGISCRKSAVKHLNGGVLSREKFLKKRDQEGGFSYTITAGAQDLIGEASLASLTLGPQARKSQLQVVGLCEVFLVDFCLLGLAVRAHSFLCGKAKQRVSNIRKSQTKQTSKMKPTIGGQGGFATKAGGSLHSVFHEPAN